MEPKLRKQNKDEEEDHDEEKELKKCGEKGEAEKKQIRNMDNII